MIETNDERESGKSLLAACHDEDNIFVYNASIYIYIYIYMCVCVCVRARKAYADQKSI